MPLVPARWRAVLAYVGLYTAIAAEAPYFPLYLASLGLDLAAVGALVGTAAALALVAAPLWGALDDRLDGSPLVLAAAAVAASVGALLVMAAGATPWLLPGAALLAAGAAGVGPLVDVRVLQRASGADRAGYGPVRAWGSLTYIAASWLTGLAADRFGIGVIFPIAAAAMLLTAVAGGSLRLSPGSRMHNPWRAIGSVVRTPALGMFLGGALLTWVGFSAVSSFYGLRLDELGASAATIGLASALGAAVEVPIMLAYPRLAERFRPTRLLVAGAALFAVRGLGAAIVDRPEILVLLSGVNGIGYALFVVGGVAYVSRHAPAGLAATAQGIFQSATQGVGRVAGSGPGGLLATLLGLPALFLLSGIVGGIGALVVRAGARDTPASDAASAGPAPDAASAVVRD